MPQLQRRQLRTIGPAITLAPLACRLRGISSTSRLPYGYSVTGFGDHRKALGDEFIRVRATLERYLRARGAGHEAEDIVQELWFKIDALPPDTEVSDPAPYLFRMANNLILDRRRTSVRRGVRERHYVELSEATVLGIDPSPSQDRVLEGRASLSKIERVLDGLGERTDFIFRRYRIDGIGQRDIAAELNITLSAVEKHLQKAYKAVHAAYVQGGEDELA